MKAGVFAWHWAILAADAARAIEIRGLNVRARQWVEWPSGRKRRRLPVMSCQSLRSCRRFTWFGIGPRLYLRLSAMRQMDMPIIRFL